MVKKKKEEKQKKYNYKYIIGIIIGGIIFGTLGTIAATQIASANVTYSKNGTSVTVESALNDLFGKVGNCPDGKTCLNHELKYLNKIKIGDYVKMTPSKTSYIISTSQTYYTSNQTIKPNELNI